MEPLVQFFAPYPKTDKTVTATKNSLTETEHTLTNNEQEVEENELPEYVRYLDLRFPFTFVEHMKRPPLTEKAQTVEELCVSKSDETENATGIQMGNQMQKSGQFAENQRGQIVNQNVVNQNGNDCFMVTVQNASSTVNNRDFGHTR